MAAALLAGGLGALCACAAMDAAEKADQRRFSADRLGDPDVEGEMLAEALGPRERAAARDVGIPVKDAPDAADAADDDIGPDAKPETGSDKAGKIGVVLLSVSVTLGMLVAPFFMF